MNPLDPRLVPGGSSSGCAVAVAEGWVAFALGTDTAGSGRVPAAMCEIAGLKPAVGHWSTEGVVPACRSLDCVSVFADVLDDAVVVASVLDGEGTWLPVAGAGARVGVPDDATMASCDPETAAAFAEQVERIRGAGHETVVVEFADFLEVGEFLYGPWVAERAESVGAFIRDHVDEVDPIVAGIVLGGYDVTDDDVAQGRSDLAAARQWIEPIWSIVDVLLTPTVPFVPTLDDVSADPIGLNRRLGTFTHPVNLLGWVAASVPGPRRADGRPSSATVLSSPGREHVLTRVAADATAGDSSDL